MALTPGGLTFAGFRAGVGESEGGIQAGPLSGTLSDGRFCSCVWRWHTGLKCRHPHGVHCLFLHPVYQLPPPTPQGNLRVLCLPALGTSLSFPDCPLRWPLCLPARVLSPWSPRPRLHWCASPEAVGYDALPWPYLHVGVTGSSEAAEETTLLSTVKKGCSGGSAVRHPHEKQGTQVQSPLEKETVTHSRILAWNLHGQKGLVGYSLWGHKEPDTT